MKRYFKPIFPVFFCCAFWVGYATGGEAVIGDSDLVVKGEKWEFLNNENKIIVNEKVKATSPDFILFSDNLVVYYENDSEKVISNAPSTQKVKIVNASDNVIIEFNNGYTSTSDKADYYKDKNEVILIGNARVISDKNQVSGCMITYHLDSNSYDIDSCPDEQAGGKVKE